MSSALKSLDTAGRDMQASSFTLLFSALCNSGSLDTFEQVPIFSQSLLSDDQEFNKIVEIIKTSQSIKHFDLRDKGAMMDA